MEAEINQQNKPVQSIPEHQQSPVVFDNVISFLKEKNINFQLIEHESASTSSQSAKTRNTPLEWGSKTMLIRGKTSEIIMLLYRANRKVSWNKVRKIDFVGKKSKMITKQQLYDAFKLLPGAVPPFANVLKIKGIIDSKFGDSDKMAFNAGLKSKSIIMDFKQFPIQSFQKYDIIEDEVEKV